MAGYDFTGKLTIVVTWSAPVQAENVPPTQAGAVSNLIELPRSFDGKVIDVKLKHMQVITANDQELVALAPYYAFHPYSCLLLKMEDFIQTEVLTAPPTNPSDCFPVPLVPRSLNHNDIVYYNGNLYHYWLTTPDGTELSIPVKRRRNTNRLRFELLQPAWTNNAGQMQGPQRAYGIQWAAMWLEITVQPDNITGPHLPYVS